MVYYSQKELMAQNMTVKSFQQTSFLRMNFPEMSCRWRQNMSCTLTTSNLKNANYKIAHHIAKMPIE